MNWNTLEAESSRLSGVSDHYKQAFGNRIVRLLTNAIPRFQSKHACFRDRPFRINGTDFGYVWNAAVPERHQLANNTLQAWIDGEAIPRGRERRELLAEFLGVSVDYLFDGIYPDAPFIPVVEFRQQELVSQVRASNESVRRRLRELRVAVRHLSLALDAFEDGLDR